ncbi:MAG TPA: ABC transporter ATP-binding protein [Acetobacteraceae bacterium]|nr:ABC transporter ATP-binding protein [Acetobacteraceae bacterium]
MSAPALQVQDLVAGYEPGLPIVRGASIAVAPAEIVVLLGPNGAGKSTLAKAVAGLVPVSGGEVRLRGMPITALPAHLLPRRGLAFVPQTENVFPGLTVRETLDLAAAILPAAERPAQIAQMLALFPDLAAMPRRRAGALSGGQRQMLAIARALITRPAVLILDEPSAGLSPRLVGLILGKLAEIRAHGVAVLLVEQNVRAALAIADRAYVLVEGRPAHEGPAAALLDDPVVAALYLGGRRAA